MNRLKSVLYRLLRRSERYTQIDMLYAARSGFWVNANFLTVSFFALLLSIGFANFLTKETYGTYQYLFSIYAICTALTLTGMNSSITQAVARGYAKTLPAALRPQLLWNAVPAALTLLGAGYYAYVGNTTIAIGLTLMAAALPLYNAFNSYTAYLVGTQDFRRTFFYACSVNIPYYLCMFAGIYFLHDALWLVAINLTVNTAITIANYYRIVRTIPSDSTTDSEAISYGKKVTFANSFAAVANQIDNLLVFHFLGAGELAAYALIRLLPERLGGAFKAVLTPAFPRIANQTPEVVRSTILHRSGLLLIASLGITVLYAGISYVAFPIIYPQYAAYAHLSAVYALTLTSIIGTFATTALTAQKRTVALYSLNTFVPAAQLVLQALGLLMYGLWGLVYAKILGTLIMNIAGVFFVRYVRTRG
jgi:O-antigen/teichoic acid export membrane protein